MKKIFSGILILIFLFTLHIFPATAITSQDKFTPAPVIESAHFDGGELSSSFTVSFTHSLETAERLREYILSVALGEYGSEEALRNSPEAYLLAPSGLYLQISYENSEYITLKELTDTCFTVSADEILQAFGKDAFSEDVTLFSLRVLLASSDFEERTDGTVYIFTPSEKTDVFITSDGTLLPTGIPVTLDEALSEDLILPLPKRTGYTFDGWSGENDTRIRLLGKGTSEFFLNTHWIPKTYEINYKIVTRSDMNLSFIGADNTLNPDSYTVGTAQIINPLNTPDTRFTFGGWYYTEDFSGDPVTQISPGETGDKILYAKWISAEEKAEEERKKREEYIKEKQYGDVDGDGTVSANDARCVLRMVVGLDFADPELLRRADLEGTSTVSAQSARALLRIAVGLDNMYDILLQNGLLP